MNVAVRDSLIKHETTERGAPVTRILRSGTDFSTYSLNEANLRRAYRSRPHKCPSRDIIRVLKCPIGETFAGTCFYDKRRCTIST